MGVSVDRRGSDSVIQGFELYEVPCFSVWQGSGKQQQLKFAYSGNDIGEAVALLQQNLEALEDSGSVATYTLKAHSGPDPDGYISNGTKYIGSFNFCMRGENTPARQHYEGAGGRVPGVPYQVQKQLDELQAKLDAVLNRPIEPDDDEEDDVFVRRVGAVSDAIGQIPGAPDIIAGLAQRFLGIEIPVSGMAGVPAGDLEGLDELDQVILQLRGHDPKLTLHLQQLLKIAENNPGQFRMLLGMLEKMS